MSGAIPPLPQYAFMVWCSVKHRATLPLPLPLPLYIYIYDLNAGWYLAFKRLLTAVKMEQPNKLYVQTTAQFFM
jgi:hypothetical protein